jgi:site-specific DNA-methyltransferase (adenine-specific)
MIDLRLGDCLEIMKDMPDKSVDLVLTDPPYGIGYEYLTYKDTKENLIELIKGFVPEVLRIAKRTAIFSGVQNISLYPQSDWVMSYSWDTTATYGKMGYNQWQPILFYGQDIKGFGSVNGILKSDSIKLSGGASIGFLSKCPKGKHPCPKPEKIIKKMVARLSNNNESILDPFMGSGTTGVAAKELGRNFIGIEISSDYYNIAEKRINNTQGNLL